MLLWEKSLNSQKNFCQNTLLLLHFLLFHKFSVKLNSCTYLLFITFSCHCITAPLLLHQNGQFITFQMHGMTQNCNSSLINWSQIGFWTILAGPKFDILTRFWSINSQIFVKLAVLGQNFGQNWSNFAFWLKLASKIGQNFNFWSSKV